MLNIVAQEEEDSSLKGLTKEVKSIPFIASFGTTRVSNSRCKAT